MISCLSSGTRAAQKGGMKRGLFMEYGQPLRIFTTDQFPIFGCCCKGVGLQPSRSGIATSIRYVLVLQPRTEVVKRLTLRFPETVMRAMPTDSTSPTIRAGL